MIKDRKKSAPPPAEDLTSSLKGLPGSFGKTLTFAASRREDRLGNVKDGLDKITSRVRVQGRMHVRIESFDSTLADKSPRFVNTARAATPSAAVAPPTTCPLAYDLVDGDSASVLIADLPGASTVQMALCADGGMLLLSTTGPRRFAARIPQPCSSRLDKVEPILTNGIFTLIVPKEETR